MPLKVSHRCRPRDGHARLWSFSKSSLTCYMFPSELTFKDPGTCLGLPVAFSRLIVPALHFPLINLILLSIPPTIPWTHSHFPSVPEETACSPQGKAACVRAERGAPGVWGGALSADGPGHSCC